MIPPLSLSRSLSGGAFLQAEPCPLPVDAGTPGETISQNFLGSICAPSAVSSLLADSYDSHAYPNAVPSLFHLPQGPMSSVNYSGGPTFPYMK